MAACTPLKQDRVERHMARIRGAGVKAIVADFTISFDTFTKNRPTAVLDKHDSESYPPNKRRKTQVTSTSANDNAPAKRSIKTNEIPTVEPVPASAIQEDSTHDLEVTRIKPRPKQKPKVARLGPGLMNDDAQTTTWKTVDNRTATDQSSEASTKPRSNKQNKRTRARSPPQPPAKKAAESTARGNSPLHEMDHNTAMNRPKSKKASQKPTAQLNIVVHTADPAQPTRPAPKTRQQAPQPRRKSSVARESRLAAITEASRPDENVDWLFDGAENPTQKVTTTRSKTKGRMKMKTKTAMEGKKKAVPSDDIDLDDLLSQVATFAQ